MSQHEVKLGQLVSEGQLRDAIHIAVAPVVATTMLAPGAHVGFVDEGTRNVGTSNNPVGIIDPFLTASVRPGQRCFLLLYPQTITSLRHEWTHPAFEATRSISQKEASRLWIEAFAARIDQTYNRLMDAAADYEKHGEYTYDNSESYKGHWGQFPEFWKHYEIITGNKVSDEARERCPFTCSC